MKSVLVLASVAILVQLAHSQGVNPQMGAQVGARAGQLVTDYFNSNPMFRASVGAWRGMLGTSGQGGFGVGGQGGMGAQMPAASITG